MNGLLEKESLGTLRARLGEKIWKYGTAILSRVGKGVELVSVAPVIGQHFLVMGWLRRRLCDSPPLHVKANFALSIAELSKTEEELKTAIQMCVVACKMELTKKDFREDV